MPFRSDAPGQSCAHRNRFTRTNVDGRTETESGSREVRVLELKFDQQGDNGWEASVLLLSVMDGKQSDYAIITCEKASIKKPRQQPQGTVGTEIASNYREKRGEDDFCT
uniref:Uncharacterized protein n=1 Tax=Schistocephalus solidus TaxID=70667 RepID=A0A0X3PCU9_SCHSO